MPHETRSCGMRHLSAKKDKGDKQKTTREKRVSAGLKHKGPKGRKVEAQGTGASVPGDGFGVAASQIAHVASPVEFGVAVEYLPVKTPFRHTHAIVVSRHGGEVEDEDKKIVRVFGLPDEGDNASLIITEINPFEATVIEINLVHGRLFPVERR